MRFRDLPIAVKFSLMLLPAAAVLLTLLAVVQAWVSTTSLEKKGLAFNTAETQSFRELLNKNCFYKEWRGKFGEDNWKILEAAAGALA